MGARISPGFTIIETMLFLAVTGLLVLGVLIGTGTALNNQRYRDAVESFKNLLQEQYADLSSVQNGRGNDWSCNSTALPAQGGDTIRGQSDCLMVGKYMRIQGNDITIYPVLAYKTGSATPGSLTDVVALDTQYAYNVSTAEIDDTAMEWGTQIAWPKSGTGAHSPNYPRSLGILFIRSPESGSVYTFSSDSVPAKNAINQATFTNLINEGTGIPGQGARRICVLSSGLFPTGDTGIYITPYAASSSAIEVQSNDFIQSEGGTARC